MPIFTSVSPAVFPLFQIRYFVFRYSAIRYFAFDILPRRYFAFDILLPRYFAFDILSFDIMLSILSFDIMRFDILSCRYIATSIFCDRYFALDILPFVNLRIRYFAIRYFAIRYFAIQYFAIRYFVIRYFVFRYFVRNPSLSQAPRVPQCPVTVYPFHRLPASLSDLEVWRCGAAGPVPASGRLHCQPVHGGGARQGGPAPDAHLSGVQHQPDGAHHQLRHDRHEL